MLAVDLPYTLRPYQLLAAKKYALAAFSRRVAGMLVLPTGTGKTRLAYYIALGLGGRTLFCTHTDVLVNQVEQEVRRLFPKLKFGVVKGPRDDYRADFVLASIQTLGSSDRLARISAALGESGFDMIIHDEGHHAIADSVYDRVVKAFPRAHVLGLTATPERMDGKLLGDVFTDGIIHRYLPQQAVDDGWLVPVTDGAGNNGRSRRVTVPELDAAVAAASDGGRDPFKEKEAARVACVKAAASSILEGVRVFKRRVIAFTHDVRSAKEVAARARDLGIKAVYVRGDMRKEEFKQGDLEFKDMEDLLAAHKKGWIEAVVNCNVLLEGHDDPSLSGIVWMRLTMSRSLWCQGIGRGMRPVLGPDGLPDFARKADVIVWDLVGAQEIHGLQTAETVFADEAEEDDEDAIDEALAEAGGGGGPVDRERSMLLNLVLALSGGRTKASATRGDRAAWLEVAQNECYAMRGLDGATYTIEKVGPSGRDSWVAFRDPKGGGPSVRITGPMPEEAVKAIAEGTARAGESYNDRNAGWRCGKPSKDLAGAVKSLSIALPKDHSAGDAADAVTIKLARIIRNTRGGPNGRGIVVSGAAMLD